MGMTIEKAIDRLEDLHFEQDNWEDGELTEDCLLNKEALRQAIDIMRKYQKIEEILDQLIDSKIRTYDAVIEIEDIVYGQTEVGNGNDD